MLRTFEQLDYLLILAYFDAILAAQSEIQTMRHALADR
jgi:hypothetical protein